MLRHPVPPIEDIYESLAVPYNSVDPFLEYVATSLTAYAQQKGLPLDELLNMYFLNKGIALMPL